MDRAATSRGAAPHRSAFTLIEVVLSLVLGTMVISAILGTIHFATATNRAGHTRFESTIDLSITHRALTRAMQTLVAKPYGEGGFPGGEGAGIPGGGEAGGEDEGDGENASGSEIMGFLQSAGIDPATIQDETALADLLDQDVDETQAMMFELFYAEAPGADVALPVLEVVTLEPPITPPPNPKLDKEYFQSIVEEEGMTEEEALEFRAESEYASTYRGVFELVQYEDRWALQYTQLDPPGRPVILLPEVRMIEIDVLPRADQLESGEDEWQDAWAAQTPIQFPLAVRFSITVPGYEVEWVFETESTIKETE